MSDNYQIEQAFRLWYKPLCLYAVHYLGSIDEAEDAVQEVFCTLMQKSLSGGYVSVTRPFLYTSVRNRCLDILKSSSVRNSAGDADSLSDMIADDSELEDRSVEEARLWSAVDRLPKKCRNILLMNKVQGMKYSEIATELGISENTVKNQMAKALKTIKESVKKAILFLFSL